MRTAKRGGAVSVILPALFAIYFIALFQITVFRYSNLGIKSVNLTPFITIAEYLRFILKGNTGDRFAGLLNILGNLYIFVPLGYTAALLFPGMRKIIKILVLAFIFSLFIEVLQYVFARGAADIDDIILNVIGGAVGYRFFKLTARLNKRKKYAALTIICALIIAPICLGSYVFSRNRLLVSHPAPVNSPEAVETAWCLILVNKWNYLPDEYEVKLAELSNGQLVDERIYPALQEMFDAARGDGVYPVVASGYRTSEEQQRLMDEKTADYEAEGYSALEAARLAQAWVAIPGTSEHQLGIAVDINADGVHSAGYEVYEWMGQNAHKFGFIRRYPPEKTAITGVENEPWHYRYVGEKAAAEIYKKGICLEEYSGLYLF